MRILTVLLLCVISTVMLAQSRLEKPEMYIGTSHGIIGSKVLFKPSIDQGFLLGYNGGIVFRYIAEKNVGMQAELNFSQRGWRESSGNYTRQLNYIELPFMTHIYVGNKNRFFVNIGPKINYLLFEKAVKNTTTDVETQHVTNIQNSFDYGVCGGLGFLVKVKKNVFQIDTRANFGLSDVFSNDKRDYFDASNNFNLSVNLGWLFQLK